LEPELTPRLRPASRAAPAPGLQTGPRLAAAGPTHVESIRDGVFFTLPDALPRGRHTLSREQIKAAQKERLLAGTTELLAARGYRGFSAGDIAKRAGVSLAAFYDCFHNKDECIFAGYDRFIEVLLSRMTAIDTTQSDRTALVHAVINAYLEAMQSDSVVARAYQVEIDALGPPARERRRNSLKLFASFLQQLMQDTTRDGAPSAELPWTAYIGVVYASRQLVSDAFDEHAEPNLRELGAELELWTADVFRQR
jgi:AcrR family transcriptional regulator